jgi:hypothetical protein
MNNILIGCIKHNDKSRVEIWAKSASKFVSGKIVLICLDEIVPENLYDLEHWGVEIVHMSTPSQNDINISKFERYHIVREYLKNIEDDSSTILLTDTFDVVFQSDPFAWYKENKTNKIFSINHQYLNSQTNRLFINLVHSLIIKKS